MIFESFTLKKIKILVCLNPSLFKNLQPMSHRANKINPLYLYTYSECVVFRIDVVGLTGSSYFTAEDDMG